MGRRGSGTDGGILELLGWTLWEEDMVGGILSPFHRGKTEPGLCVRCVGLLSYVLASNTDKFTLFLHVCNYSLLRIFPCAMSLGLALGRVLLSILLWQKTQYPICHKAFSTAQQSQAAAAAPKWINPLEPTLSASPCLQKTQRTHL